MSAYVVDELLAAVPSGTIVLTVAESNEVDYESVEFIATMLRQHLTEQEVAADQHWLNPEMESQGASYAWPRSEEHTSELQSLMRISYAVFCLKKKKKKTKKNKTTTTNSNDTNSRDDRTTKNTET